MGRTGRGMIVWVEDKGELREFEVFGEDGGPPESIEDIHKINETTYPHTYPQSFRLITQAIMNEIDLEVIRALEILEFNRSKNR